MAQRPPRPGIRPGRPGRSQRPCRSEQLPGISSIPWISGNPFHAALLQSQSLPAMRPGGHGPMGPTRVAQARRGSLRPSHLHAPGPLGFYPEERPSVNPRGRLGAVAPERDGTGVIARAAPKGAWKSIRAIPIDWPVLRTCGPSGMLPRSTNRLTRLPEGIGTTFLAGFCRPSGYGPTPGNPLGISRGISSPIHREPRGPPRVRVRIVSSRLRMPISTSLLPKAS